MSDFEVTMAGEQVGYATGTEFTLNDLADALEREDATNFVPGKLLPFPIEMTLTKDDAKNFNEWWQRSTRQQRDFINTLWSKQCREYKRKLKRLWR